VPHQQLLPVKTRQHPLKALALCQSLLGKKRQRRGLDLHLQQGRLRVLPRLPPVCPPRHNPRLPHHRQPLLVHSPQAPQVPAKHYHPVAPLLANLKLLSGLRHCLRRSPVSLGGCLVGKAEMTKRLEILSRLLAFQLQHNLVPQLNLPQLNLHSKAPLHLSRPHLRSPLYSQQHSLLPLRNLRR
jgi:hypothetical protein